MGLAIARALAAQDRSIVVAERHEDRCAAAVDALRAEGCDAVGVVGDVSTTSGAESAVAAALEGWGRIDVLVNTVGGMKGPVFLPFWEITDEQWSVTLDVTLSSAFRCIRAATPHFQTQRSGRIINIGSTSWAGVPEHVHYSAAKAGLFALTRAVAVALGPYDVTANVVAPGGTRTLVAGHPRSGFPNAEQWKNLNPLGRPNEPEDVADAVAFLASPAARNISGEHITVAGGLNPSL
jgi:meso-butanediol dehydrogenase/(S,S)-butanediol dehydrogenase/diacetyl reductase